MVTVSWSGDGHVSGFDYATQRSAFVAPLATAGAVDANWPTRLQYTLDSSHPTSIDAQATLVFSGSGFFTPCDIGEYVAPASAFAAGHIPTITEIMAAAISVQGSATAVNVSGTYTLTVTGPGMSVLVAGTKYWVAVVPRQGGTPLGDPEVNGRATSVWTNRTPSKPMLVVSANSIPAGGSFTLSLSDGDPDQVSTATVMRRDCAGVQVQYAPRPTPGNPTPTWTDLPITNKSRNGFSDGSFQSGIVGWSASLGMASIAWANSSPPFGYELVATPTTGYPNAWVQSPKSTITAGKQYWFGGTVAFNPLTTDGRTTVAGFAMLRWYSDAGATTQVGSDQYGPTLNCSISGETVLYGMSVAPTGAVTARVFFNVATADPANGFHSADRIVLGYTYINDVRRAGNGNNGYGAVGGDGSGSETPYATGYVFENPGWWIDGGNNQHVPIAGAAELWQSESIPVQCSANSAAWVSGNGQLASGDWQLRVRTFDYGHPYPLEFGAMGTTGDTLTPDTISASNVSPWSDTVNVTVLAEVPSPNKLSPSGAVAIVKGNPITFSWNYRNTHVPTPYAQADYQTEIREVGASYWSALWSDTGTATSFTTSQGPDWNERFSGTIGTFEDGSTNGWGVITGGGTLSVVSGSAPSVHSGSHALMATGSAGAVAPARNISLASLGSDNVIEVSGWANLVSGSATGGFSFGLRFLNSGGAAIGSALQGSVLTNAPGWQFGTVLFAGTPPAGTVNIQAFVVATNSAGNPISVVLDDMSFRTRSNAGNTFPFKESTEYEWRVTYVHDTNGQISDPSAVARFWVVPQPASGAVIALPTSTIDGATLGCGKHTVEIYRRGGTERVGVLKNLSHVDWGRQRDDISTAQIVVSGWDVDCGNLLASLQTWAYEVVIFRNNGYTVDRVFEGPITLLTYEQDKVTIDAKDVMVYLYRRIIKQTMDDTANGDTVVSRAARVIQNVMAPDDPNVLAYLQILAKDDDAKERRSVPAYSRTAYEEIDDMAANAGLDYAAVGRAILLWDTSHRIGTLPELRDKDLGSPPIVSEYGMSMANVYVVSDGNGVWGEANRLNSSGNDPVYGLVELLSSSWASDSTGDSGTYTQAGLATVQASFATSAERSIKNRYTAPVVVRVPDGTTLSPDAPVSIQHLIPGVGIPIRSTGTLRQVAWLQKLDSIRVVEEKDNETVQLTMSPFNVDEALAAEESGS